MPLAETLALTIGSAIAKNVLKIWFKDQSLAQDISSDMASLISSKITSSLDQRRARRKFEEVGEKVAARLLPLCDEWRLDEANAESVIHIVGSVLERTPFDLELLIRYNLDASLLGKFFRDAHPTAARDFGAIKLRYMIAYFRNPRVTLWILPTRCRILRYER